MTHISVEFTGNEEMARDMEKSASEFKSNVRKNIVRAAALIQKSIQVNLGGKVLNIGNNPGGRLRQSVGIELKGSGVGTVASIGPQRIKYARIHELGGIIEPKTKKALRFQIGGEFITVKRVVIPARPYIKPAIEENLERIADLMGESFGVILAT